MLEGRDGLCEGCADIRVLDARHFALDEVVDELAA